MELTFQQAVFAAILLNTIVLFLVYLSVEALVDNQLKAAKEKNKRSRK